jgi:pimeloyl-ACP methyl ester carboxylesterase
MKISAGVKQNLILAVFMLSVAAVSTAQDSKPNWRSEPDNGPLLDAMVDVGGRRLHINCTGKGDPVVVMDAGRGNSSATWNLVQPEVAKFARVCVYDRAGLGSSEPAVQLRTSQQMVRDLHALLTNARIRPPYIMVGHSLGGMNVRLYASQYPKDVIGMVLVDSAHGFPCWFNDAKKIAW